MSKLIILTGLPGSGRTAVGKSLERMGFCRIILRTCRPPRQGEQDGVDFFFITQEEFDTLPIKNGVYGLTSLSVSADSVVSAPPGLAELIRRSVPNSVVVWLDAPSGVRRYRLVHDLGVSPGEAQKLLHVPFALDADAVVDSSGLKTAEKVLEVLGYLKPGDVPIEGDFDPRDREMVLREVRELARQRKPKKVRVETEGDEYVLHVAFDSHIVRTRRITGYLASSDRFNAAKKAELRDRRPQMTV